MFDSAARLLAVAFALFAVILAGHWLTELTAPRPVAELPSAAMIQPESNTQWVSRLFGSSKEVQSQALAGLHLTGVYAGSKGGGFATIHTRAGDVPVFPGDEVAPGVILKQIESDRVILLSSGIQKELRLSESNASAAISGTQKELQLHENNAPAATDASQAVRNRRRQRIRTKDEEE